MTIEKQKTVYLIYTYFEGNDGVYNPVLYADFCLAEAELIGRGKSGLHSRCVYLDPPIGEYKDFNDWNGK